MSSIPPEDIETQGHAGLLIGSQWSPPGDPTWVAVIAHGYGEHIGRYQWVAERLTADGAGAPEPNPRPDDPRLLSARARIAQPGVQRGQRGGQRADGAVRHAWRSLNDVVLHPGKSTRMIEFELHIDGQFVCSQKADGLIVAAVHDPLPLPTRSLDLGALK